MYLVFQTLGIVIIVQCVIYVLFLLGQKGDANKFLLAYLIITIVTLINIFLRDKWGIPYFFVEFLSLMGPVFYGYIRSLTGIKFFSDNLKKMALLPFAALLVLHLAFPLTYSEIEKELALFVLFYSYSFLGLGIYSIKRYHSMLLQTSSNYRAYSLKWLNYEVLIISLYFIGLGGEQLVGNSELYLFTVIVSFVALILFINLLTFKSLKAPFQLMPNREKYYEKYTASRLSKEESAIKYEKLLKLIESQNPYRNGDLSLEDLANLMDLKKPTLSQVINQNSGQNFNDFINGFRVKEAKTLLLDSQLLVKEVMYKSGFNSTSTFNSTFTKYFGVSPSKYRALNKKNS